MYRDPADGLEVSRIRIAALADDARLLIAATVVPFAFGGFAILPTAEALALALALYGTAGVAVVYFAARAGVLRRFGPANQVTWLRVALTAAVAGALAETDRPELVNWWIIGALAGLALALDGVDGWLARRNAQSSAFGARFDMEIDAALILVLSLLIGLSGKTGMWIVAAGALRYLFAMAGWIWPALTQSLPPSRLRRAVCAIQVGALLACLLPVVNGLAATVIGGAALAILCFSFARDILWLVAAPINRNPV